MIKIDQVIKDMEDYLVNCKPIKFSGNKYAVEMDVLEDYINSLKHNLPAEVKNYKKLLMNQDQILRSAQAEAKSIVDKALQEREALINNNDIVKEAYKIRDQILGDAKASADAMIFDATEYSNQVREGALEYADTVLSKASDDMRSMFNVFKGASTDFLSGLEDDMYTLDRNRNELAAMKNGQPKASASSGMKADIDFD